MAAAFTTTTHHFSAHGDVSTQLQGRYQQSCSHQSNAFAISSSRLYSSSSDSIISNNVASEIDPYSEEARANLSNFYKQNNINQDADNDHKKLLRLMEQYLSWNQRLNLISRKDCTAEVVYHRHILPSIALIPLVLKNNNNSNNSNIDDINTSPLNIADVGTGGGFPGLPLALLLPNCQFTLVDSIQKKLVAVSEMASELDVQNVRIHCGRCEEMYSGREGRQKHMGKYDVCLGRSVTALPRFCAWMYPLLKKQQKDGGLDEVDNEGRLIYIIGGELEDVVESRIQSDTYLDELLHREEGTSDKRALIFTAKDVEEIAVESGEKDKIVRSGPGKKNSGRRKNDVSSGRGKKVAKGAWQKKTNNVKKERGYDDFQRYEF